MPLIILNTQTQLSGEITGTTYGAPISVSGAKTFSAAMSVTVDTPSVKTFTDTNVNTSTSVVTVTGHGFTTGDKVRLTSTGTLPAGLATSTDYFVIVLTANTIQFASSLANALIGTFVVITDAGTAAATNTITPTAIAGGTVGLQKSNDGTNWIAEGSTTAVTVTALIWLEKVDPASIYLRTVSILTAGQMSISTVIAVKGPL